MTPVACLRLLAFTCLAPAGFGCGEISSNTTSVVATPESILDPGPATPVDETTGKVELTKAPYEEFLARIENPPGGVKYTVVDAWATYCPPCMENFPHLVEMQKKFGGKGLRCISLSMDDPLEIEDVKRAEAFLREKQATFPNFIIDGNPADVYEALKISAIPAVFVFDAKGKEIKRFTLDDPDNQFTYDQVEEYVKGLLAAEGSK